MGSEKVIARFLGDQCEWGEGLEVSEAVLYVVLSGWCKVEREEIPTLVEISAALESAGARRRDGIVRGVCLRGVDEKSLSEILGPALYDAVQSLSLPDAGARASPAEDSRPQWARGISGDSVLAFVQSCCQRHPSKHSSLRVLYEAYTAFCDLNGRRPVREERFRSTLESSKVGLEIAGRRVKGILPIQELTESLSGRNRSAPKRKARAKSR